MIRPIARLALNLAGLLEDLIQSSLHLIRDRLGLFLAVGLLAGACWLLAARGLGGKRLALWLLVPVLLAGALACWVGPDRLFPKEPYEGPELLILSENHAITLLDLPGGLCAVAAMCLGAWLIKGRWGRGEGRG